MPFDRIVSLDYGAEKRQTAGQEHELGELGATRDGRWYRYVFMNGAVTAGKLLQFVPNIAAHDMDLVTAIAAIGATSISVTLGATAIVKDEYKDGFLYVNSTTGAGQLFKIGPHAAVASQGVFAVPIRDEGGVRTALDATSECGLSKNPWKDVVVAPTTVTGAIAGATTRDMTDDYYGWAQRAGYAALIIDNVVGVIGEELVRSDTEAGAVEGVKYIDDVELEIVATTTLIAAVNGDHQLCNMCLAP